MTPDLFEINRMPFAAQAAHCHPNVELPGIPTEKASTSGRWRRGSGLRASAWMHRRQAHHDASSTSCGVVASVGCGTVPSMCIGAWRVPLGSSKSTDQGLEAGWRNRNRNRRLLLPVAEVSERTEDLARRTAVPRCDGLCAPVGAP